MPGILDGEISTVRSKPVLTRQAFAPLLRDRLFGVLGRIQLEEGQRLTPVSSVGDSKSKYGSFRGALLISPFRDGVDDAAGGP